jgi:hypothetical protein
MDEMRWYKPPVGERTIKKGSAYKQKVGIAIDHEMKITDPNLMKKAGIVFRSHLFIY